MPQVYRDPFSENENDNRTRYLVISGPGTCARSVETAVGCRIASKLKGFENAKPKQLSRKFVETSGEISVLLNRTLLVTSDRRSHNPILCEAALDKTDLAYPG